MLLGILTLITALCISAVAIYYSVAGLVAIFAAAALPIMIMGGVLEVGKLVTAVWLHRYWKQATWWLKSYLSVAVLVLMLITSMGIFGFLSKAHIEQTSASVDNVARVETLQSEIDRNLAIVGRAENRIRQLESSEVGADANIQTQIDREQERIDKAFERIQPAIEEQNTIIAGVTQLFQNELDKIDSELETLQAYLDANDIEKAQAMVGTKVDGDYGPKTAAAFTAFQDAKRAERNEWLTKIQSAANSPTVVAARNEIQRLRKSAEDQVTQSQTLITRLQQQLANSDNAEEVQKSIDEQNERVQTASKEIDQLTEEKISLESEYRKLEAEVGPIKYIAEFVYGENADNNMLEEAVRWVIIIIIFVFDPLAVLLLIASQYTFEFRKKELEDDDGERLRLERAEYERARAQRIVDNPGVTFDDPVPSDTSSASDNSFKESVDESREETTREEQQDAEELRARQDEESLPPEIRDNPIVAEETQEERSVEDVAKDYVRTDDDLGDVVPEDDTTDTDDSATGMEQPQVPLDEDAKREIANSYIVKESKKKDPLNLETQDTLSEAETPSQESQIQKAKNTSIPDTRNRFYYKEELEDTQQYIMKEQGKQVTKETKPETSEGEAKTGYIQNAEQTNESIWKNIQKKTPE